MNFSIRESSIRGGRENDITDQGAYSNPSFHREDLDTWYPNPSLSLADGWFLVSGRSCNLRIVLREVAFALDSMLQLMQTLICQMAQMNH